MNLDFIIELHIFTVPLKLSGHRNWVIWIRFSSISTNVTTLVLCAKIFYDNEQYAKTKSVLHHLTQRSHENLNIDAWKLYTAGNYQNFYQFFEYADLLNVHLFTVVKGL